MADMPAVAVQAWHLWPPRQVEQWRYVTHAAIYPDGSTDGKDDDKGERIESPKECGADYRLYAVCAQQLIKVTIKNLSAKPLSFQPVYVDTKGFEEQEEFTAPLKQGEVRLHVCVCCWVWASGRVGG